MTNRRERRNAEAEAAKVAVVPPPEQVEMIQIPVKIASTGRPATIVIPIDATDGEMAELTGWMLTSVLGKLRADRAKNPASRLVVARGSLPS